MQLGSAVAGTVGVPILLAVVACSDTQANSCSNTTSASHVLTIARALVACGCEAGGHDAGASDVSVRNDHSSSSYDAAFTTHPSFLSGVVETFQAVVVASSSLSSDGREHFGSILFDILHMILEDQQLMGLNTSQSNGFQVSPAGGEDSGLAAATKTAAASMFCLSSQWGSHVAFARYYCRVGDAMRLNSQSVEGALALFPASHHCPDENDVEVGMTVRAACHIFCLLVCF
jgi:hypothetical protein